MTRRRLLIMGSLIAPLLLFLILLPALPGSILDGVSFSSAFLDREDDLLQVFLARDEKIRMYAPVGFFPPKLIEAILLQEDRFFYGHPGINPAAMVRAARETWIRRTRRVGASTLTMQVARLRYGLYTRSVPGKIRQILYALYLEYRYSKQEILEAYLNLAPCGGNIEGFSAAAWYYFGEDVQHLSTSEMLLLAVLPQDPTARFPRNRRAPRELLDARRVLYDSWLETNPDDSGIATEIGMPPTLLCQFPQRARHYCELLKRSLPGVSAPRRSTLSPELQKICEQHLSSYLERNRGFGVSNGSIMLIDWTTMEVLASIGSADYFSAAIQGSVDGTIAKRSPGSTLKPFIYALAIEQGLIHPETMLKDTKVSFNEYAPDNYQNDYRGPVNAWDALVDSRNIPAVFLAQQLKSPDLYELMVNAGIQGMKSRDHYGLSIVLGSAECTMTELLSLYSALPNNGRMSPLRYLVDEKLELPIHMTGKSLLSPAAAWITMRMLERNPSPLPIRPQTSRGTPVAWKTGTSVGFKDSWAIGVFDRYILAVWIGNFSGEGNSAFIGRRMSGPLFFSIVDTILADIPPAKRTPIAQKPVEVRSVPVCAVSGGIPNDWCPHKKPVWFIPGVSPITRCAIHRTVFIDTRTGFRTDERDKPWIRQEVREFWPTDLLELFELAGLPRLKPPPYPPSDRNTLEHTGGFPPSIISPRANTEYVLREGGGRNNQLVFQAGTDADTDEVFWFANSEFMGSCRPQERLVWDPSPGQWTITVVDSNGRTASIPVTVSRENE